MSQWAFVAAAYALTGTTTLGLVGAAWLAMRRAEAAADALKRKR